MITLTERKKIAKLILTTGDEKVVEKIKSIISTRTESVKSDYRKKYNLAIDKAVEEIKSGKFISESEAEDLLLKWEKE